MENVIMKTTKQYQIAEWLGCSEALISQVRAGNRTFGKKLAKNISNQTGVNFELLALGKGEPVYRAILLAFLNMEEFG